MRETPFKEAVKNIHKKDPRYAPDAYYLIREAIDFTTKTLRKPPAGPARHVTGSELAEGIKNYCLKEYGPLASTVLDSWGIKSTSDFGEIVFNLVDAGKLGKTEDDAKEDFSNLYDFHEAFDKPFEPEETHPGKTNRRKNRNSTKQQNNNKKNNGRKRT